jgi:hypothetical protein
LPEKPALARRAFSRQQLVIVAYRQRSMLMQKAKTKPNVDPIHRDGTCGLVISLIPRKPPLSVERRAS